jgi:hypothetical protein
MFRGFLTVVLVALLAMPQGVCLCPSALAGTPEVEPASESCCAQSKSEPVPPTSKPEDDPDDHERDCPCKLRQVLASDAASSIGSVRDDQTGFLVFAGANLAIVSFADIPVDLQLQLFKSLDSPIPLILCALRI